jgi:hypothetical protein
VRVAEGDGAEGVKMVGRAQYGKLSGVRVQQRQLPVIAKVQKLRAAKFRQCDILGSEGGDAAVAIAASG